MIDRETAMELASAAGFGHMLPAEPGLPKTWVGADADKLQRLCTAAFQMGAEAERNAIDEMHDAEALWAPIGHSSWGEGYQEGWGDGIKAYVDAIHARGTGGSK